MDFKQIFWGILNLIANTKEELTRWGNWTLKAIPASDNTGQTYNDFITWLKQILKWNCVEKLFQQFNILTDKVTTVEQNNDIFQKNVSCKVIELENKLKESDKQNETALNYQLETIRTLIDRIEKIEEQALTVTTQEIDDLKKKVEELEVEKSTLEAEKSAQTSTISDLAKKLQAYHANEVTKEDYTEYNKFWHNFFGLPFEEEKNDESWQKASQSPNLLQKGVNEHIRAMCEKASQNKERNGIKNILDNDEVKYIFDHFNGKTENPIELTDENVIEMIETAEKKYKLPKSQKDREKILSFDRADKDLLTKNIDRFFNVKVISREIRNEAKSHGISIPEDEVIEIAKSSIDQNKTTKELFNGLDSQNEILKIAKDCGFTSEVVGEDLFNEIIKEFSDKLSSSFGEHKSTVLTKATDFMTGIIENFKNLEGEMNNVQG